MGPTGDHVRENRSVLMSIEKRVLIAIARRLPAQLGSDHLTILGVSAMFLAGLSYVAARWDERALGLVVVALVLNWLGDSLDGTLARVRDCQRPRYGYYVDHFVDLVGAFFLLGGLAVSGYMTPILALGLLVGFLMVSAESYLATHTVGVFRLSFLGIGPTELRILLGAGTLFLLHKPTVEIGSLGPFLLFDVGGAGAIAGMAITLVVSGVRNTQFLYRAEPLPEAERVSRSGARA